MGTTYKGHFVVSNNSNNLSFRIDASIMFSDGVGVGVVPDERVRRQGQLPFDVFVKVGNKHVVLANSYSNDMLDSILHVMVSSEMFGWVNAGKDWIVGLLRKEVGIRTMARQPRSFRTGSFFVQGRG